MSTLTDEESVYIAAEEMSAWMASQDTDQTERLNDSKRNAMVEAINDSNPTTTTQPCPSVTNGLYYVVDTRPLNVVNWLLAGIAFLLMLNLFINK